MARELIAVRVLLVSRNAETIEFLCQLVQQLAMQVETCCDIQSATQRLCRGKFEGVVVDLEFAAEGLRLLEKLREMTSHRHAISCAIVEGEKNAVAAFRAHANFVLHRPFVASSVHRTFRAAYPMMFRERRRGYRHTVGLRTLVKRESGEEFWTNSVNISETGMAFSSITPVSVSERLRLRIELPGVSEPVLASGEICWNANGRAGIRFLDAPIRLPERLHCWLSERMAELVSGR